DALRVRDWADVMLVHTGQHYDVRMSQLFFDELGLPRPDIDLHVGSASHGEQTAQVLLRLEPVLQAERPDLVIVFGDVNSTLAAALAAAKLGIAVTHVEAGLRSFDRAMPEELNRIVTDHLSDVLFTTERSARGNLLREGLVDERIHFVGNVMVDTLLKHRARAAALCASQTLGLPPRGYGLLTLHRPSNVDEPATLHAILDAVQTIAEDLPIVFPCHVRTRDRLNGMGALPGIGHGGSRPGVLLLEPLGYLEFLSLMNDARLVLTDSGGIQEETTVLGVPCLTLRENTERPVTIEQGTNMLVGNSKDRIVGAARDVLMGRVSPGRIPELWDGHAAERIVSVLERQFAPVVL
ncbi:MAG TPA: UDP-N-acetylglucosamine 2-epimerase (non-hydrolyzing), partial [Nitrospirales bacterium]|nr:UDP-N-acetylglucosamine 2-epimerase (non-hydrolyzing) [Nitrospirales bacterium]